VGIKEIVDFCLCKAGKTGKKKGSFILRAFAQVIIEPENPENGAKNER
jgi:hypothetical protein